MNNIITPNDGFIRRSSGLITPITDVEKREIYYQKNYDMIAHYISYLVDGHHRIYVEDCEMDSNGFFEPRISPVSEAIKMAASPDVAIAPNDILIDPRKMRNKISAKKVCRFCGRTSPEVSFRKAAHALSELVGNKRIFLRNECDECNELFGKLYEDAFFKYLGPARTIAQIDGKEGTPSYKNEEGTIRIDVGDKRTVIQEVTGNGNIDLHEDHIDMHLIKESYSPLAVYKALVIMALSIMPYNEFKAFKEIVEWVLEKDIKKSKYDLSCYASQIIERFLAGAKPLPVQAWLFRRKSIITSGTWEVYDVPYCQFILEFDNFSFQIIVPNIQKDAVLWNRKVNVPAFPSSFDVRPELRKNRDIGSAICNFSNPEKVKGERAELSLQFEHREEQSGDLGTVEEMAKREGVKPLKPKQSKCMNNEES